MTQQPDPGQRLFVLDTNVLMHDPTAVFRFQEHDIYLPMVVLEELDRGKKGLSEVARNARQASRFLDELLSGVDHDAIVAGLQLPGPAPSRNELSRPAGRLFFQTRPTHTDMPEELPGSNMDNQILLTIIALQRERPGVLVTLVSKDINLRIKATILGVNAEDYHNDQALDDVALLYSGIRHLPDDFWETHGQSMASWQENGRSLYRISGPGVRDWYVNEGLYLDSETGFQALVRSIEGDSAVIETALDFSTSRHVWGIKARNREQNFAFNLLLDPKVDFVTLLGTAGTGKTLLALAAGLQQTLDDDLFREIIMTRVTVPVGEDIGFLPGTEEEKMTPWMGALMDNLEVLTNHSGRNQANGSWARAATNDLLSNRIKIRSLNFMRGRTFLNKYLIVDEAQNLTSKQIKTLVTRAGPGTKVVCIGNIAQIDTPYLSETTSGLTYVVDHFKEWAHSGHVTLKRGERSRLAEFASDSL